MRGQSYYQSRIFKKNLMAPKNKTMLREYTLKY